MKRVERPVRRSRRPRPADSGALIGYTTRRDAILPGRPDRRWTQFLPPGRVRSLRHGRGQGPSRRVPCAVALPVLRGLTSTPLAATIPPAAGWHNTGVPPTVSVDGVQALLDSCGRGAGMPTCRHAPGGTTPLQHCQQSRPGPTDADPRGVADRYQPGAAAPRPGHHRARDSELIGIVPESLQVDPCRRRRRSTSSAPRRLTTPAHSFASTTGSGDASADHCGPRPVACTNVEWDGEQRSCVANRVRRVHAAEI